MLPGRGHYRLDYVLANTVNYRAPQSRRSVTPPRTAGWQADSLPLSTHWGDGEGLTIEEFHPQKPQGEEASRAWKSTGKALSEIDEGEDTKEDAV